MRKEYALLAYFDHETETKLKQFWVKLNELGISDYGVAVKDRRPHVTLADYQAINVEELLVMLNDYFHQQVEVPIHFHSLGAFLGQKMLYIAPTMTKSLLDLHGNFHEQFKSFDRNPNSYYLPQRWVPHCTICGRLNEVTFLQAFEYCQRNIVNFQTRITEVGLVEVYFDDEGNIVKDKLIFSKNLQADKA